MGHIPVLLGEVVEAMMPKDGGRYFDGTLGYGGHARAILEASSPTGELAGTDLDRAAIQRLDAEMAGFGGRAHLFHGNFTEIDRVCSSLGWEKLDGILLDLGMSSTALDDPDRGVSFLRTGPLDMRFSPDNPLSADIVVNTYEEERLAGIIREYGEESFARRIAGGIVRARPLHTTTGLAEVVSAAIPRRFWPGRIHPATRTFQALRMEVNQEIESLRSFLPKAASLLSRGGVMAVISFHSLEDRIVKRFFTGADEGMVLPRGLPAPASGRENVLERVTRRSVTASEEEVARNPRARSARLRAARRMT
jgi:16S rRNA (cytosine1402-N4)-methyltransferase